MLCKMYLQISLSKLNELCWEWMRVIKHAASEIAWTEKSSFGTANLGKLLTSQQLVPSSMRLG